LRNLLLQHLIEEKEDNSGEFAEDRKYFFIFLDILENEKRHITNETP